MPKISLIYKVISSFILIFSNLNLQADKIVVAYLTSGSNEMPSSEYVTHINYAFGHVNTSYDGVEIDNPERLRYICDNKGEIKVCLSIGGWTSGGFSEMASNNKNRRLFAMDCKRIVEEFNLDGIDIDWEYPSCSDAGISSTPDDIKNHALLMHEIRSQIGENKLLTLASIASAQYVDFVAIEPIIDFVNIMVYDVARPPYHHSPLYKSDLTNSVTCEESVELHIKAGIPADKLVLGIPFYGHGVGDMSDFIDYKDIINLNGYIEQWDNKAKVPYLIDSDGKLVCTYDNAKSIYHKCEFIENKGLLGVMYWDYCIDDSKYTLRKAVAKEILNKKFNK